MFRQVCRRINSAIRRSKVRFSPINIHPSSCYRNCSSKVQQMVETGSSLSTQPLTLASAQSRDILVTLGMELVAFTEDDEESR